MSDMYTVTPRSPELEALGETEHALALIASQSAASAETSRQPEAVDPHASYRIHLTQLACRHVADALADYLPADAESHGFTPRQIEDIIKIAEMVVRDFAFGVVKGNIDLEPNSDPVVIFDVTDTARAPETPEFIDEGRGIN